MSFVGCIAQPKFWISATFAASTEMWEASITIRILRRYNMKIRLNCFNGGAATLTMIWFNYTCRCRYNFGIFVESSRLVTLVLHASISAHMATNWAMPRDSTTCYALWIVIAVITMHYTPFTQTMVSIVIIIFIITIFNRVLTESAVPLSHLSKQ